MTSISGKLEDGTRLSGFPWSSSAGVLLLLRVLRWLCPDRSVACSDGRQLAHGSAMKPREHPKAGTMPRQIAHRTVICRAGLEAMGPTGWYYAKLAAFSAFPLIPLLAPIGYYAGLPWLSPLFVFFAIPGFDLLIGTDHTRPLERPVPRAASAWLYLLPHLYLLAWLAALAWAASTLPEASPTGRASILIASALSSAFATCAAHELLHRPGTLDRLMSRLAMSSVAYGQFVTEHLHHHGTVGIVRAGTTPTLGQSVWSFVVRNVAFSFGNSWRIERRRQVAAGKPLLGNVYVQQWLSTAVIFGAFVAFGGVGGAVLFLAQAGFAIFALEYINYAEHYGLTRRPSEPPSGRLAWSSNGFMTNAMTLNITRHAHHHERPGVPYQDLRHMETMPLFPAGYFALFFPAMVPPLWRRIMDASASEVVNVLQAEHVG